MVIEAWKKWNQRSKTFSHEIWRWKSKGTKLQWCWLLESRVWGLPLTLCCILGNCLVWTSHAVISLTLAVVLLCISNYHTMYSIFIYVFFFLRQYLSILPSLSPNMWSPCLSFLELQMCPTRARFHCTLCTCNNPYRNVLFQVGEMSITRFQRLEKETLAP